MVNTITDAPLMGIWRSNTASQQYPFLPEVVWLSV